VNPNPDTARVFYDDFLVSRLCDYRFHKNARIEAAIQRVLPFVTVDSNVLDVGCGIGLVAERVARKAKSGFIWALISASKISLTQTWPSGVRTSLAE
jgi:ubiquinone/menaquinone biosynthesis C-methylase UbiE